MDAAERPIVIKKIKKGGHGHHGGAWKVAFADFATAMMAFFLLLWLMATATPEQKQAISSFFLEGASSAVGSGGGFSDSMINFGGAGDTQKGTGDDWKQDSEGKPTAEEVAKENKEMEQLLETLKQAIEEREELKAFKDQLKLEATPEGLRIQIVDKENRPMFKSGDAAMRDHAIAIIREIAPIINRASNRISITGHTDAAPFGGGKSNYTNWELSADRANAARRQLIAAGLDPKKVGRVVGLADSALYNQDNPLDPINRRISIVVMNKATDEAIDKANSGITVDGKEPLNLDGASLPETGEVPLAVVDGAKALAADNIIVDTIGHESAAPALAAPVAAPVAIQPPLAESTKAAPLPPKPPAPGHPVVRLNLGIEKTESVTPVPAAPTAAEKPPATPQASPHRGATPLSLPGL